MAIIATGSSTSGNANVDSQFNVQTRVNDSAGREVSPQVKATYSCSTTPFTPPATPTDLSLIRGSGTKTIRVTGCSVTTTQTTAGINRIYLTKHSTANTSGTSSTITAVPHDSNNAAVTATVLSYTVNPSVGSVVGNIAVMNLNSPVLATGIAPSPDSDMFPNPRSFELAQPVTLRGATQELAVNFNGAALPTGLSVIVNWTWTEE